jgi:hypothetical protein
MNDSTRESMLANKDAPMELPALRRFTKARATTQERCELCGAVLGEVHPHLLDLKSRQIACSCDACAIVFCGQEGGRFLRIPRRILRVDAHMINDLDWEAMMLPINLAFFIRDAQGKIRAMYPSPAGAIESQIDLNRFDGEIGIQTCLHAVEPEVEALLVNRIGTQNDCYIVPLDECYRLVGIVKTKWRGLSGGPEVWVGIHEFFQQLDARAGGKPLVHHA